jgi:hypothetical protein
MFHGDELRAQLVEYFGSDAREALVGSWPKERISGEGLKRICS